MNPQAPVSNQVVTMFLKPSFLITAQGNGLQVAVTVERPRPNVRN
jgi:hypothetical protein